MMTRVRSGAISMAIISRRSASLMAARTFALPTLARSAIRATGRVHFPVAAASFRMTASTAIASVFRSSLIEAVRPRSQREIDGPTLHVGRSPTCYGFLPSESRSSIKFYDLRNGNERAVQGIDVPYIYRGGGEAKVRA